MFNIGIEKAVEVAHLVPCKKFKDMAMQLAQHGEAFIAYGEDKFVHIKPSTSTDFAALEKQSVRRFYRQTLYCLRSTWNWVKDFFHNMFNSSGYNAKMDKIKADLLVSPAEKARHEVRSGLKGLWDDSKKVDEVLAPIYTMLATDLAEIKGLLTNSQDIKKYNMLLEKITKAMNAAFKDKPELAQSKEVIDKQLAKAKELLAENGAFPNTIGERFSELIEKITKLLESPPPAPNPAAI